MGNGKEKEIHSNEFLDDASGPWVLHVYISLREY